MTFAGIGNVDVDYADGDYVEDYDHEPGSNRFGIRAEIGGSVGSEFDVTHLPPPPNEPPPPLPDVHGTPEVGVEGGIVVEKKKKKKKHRDGERGEGEDENGERRHRKKKKKHREGGEGEDGERPRRHRRHRREATEGDAEADGESLGVTVNPGVDVNIQGGAAVPAVEHTVNYSGDIPGHFEVPSLGDVGVSAEAHPNYTEYDGGVSYYQEHPDSTDAHFNADAHLPAVSPPETQFTVNVDHQQSPRGGPAAFAVEETWSTGSPSVEHPPPSDTRVVADPVIDAGPPAVEDYYYRSSPKTNRILPGYDALNPPTQFAAPVKRGWPPTSVQVDPPNPEVDVVVPSVQTDEFAPPEPEPVVVTGDMALSPDAQLVVEAPPPSDVPGFQVNGGGGYDPQYGGDPGNFMPLEPGDQQQMYSVNPEDPNHGMYINEPQLGMSHEMTGPPPIPDPPKQKGGISKLFGLRKSGGKGKKGKKNESEIQVSAPMGVPHDGMPSGNYAPSPIVGGTPSSTLRSGGVQQDPWQSNPQLFNPNMDTLDPQMGRTGTLDQQPQPGGRGGKKGKKLPSTRPIPSNRARVILLDGEEIEVDVDKKGLGREIFERVCDHLSIEERDYFGLTYSNRKEQTWFWLDVEKKVSKQLKNNEEWFFNFQVKFYPPEPALIQEDITRYQLTLQVRQDIFTGKLPCSWVTQALLGSFLVQSELGDFDPDEHHGIEYLRQFEFVHDQIDQLLYKIAELHSNHKGMTPDQADLKYLETAKRLEQYGYDLHPARDMDDVDIFIGVSFSGAVVYRGSLRISRFAWPKVLRISYRKNFFYLKIRSECYDDFEAIVGFKLFNNKMAKRLWKIAVEHHTFFRLKEPRFAPKTNVIPRFGSRYRYSGRTFFQYRTMSIDRPHPNFDRSLTKRRTASMPMLAGGGGSHYGSMHSLSRPHPRALTINKVQSVEYLGPGGPLRTPTMGPRSGSVEFGAPSSIGGSLQNIPASSGHRVMVGSGGGVRSGTPQGRFVPPVSQPQSYGTPPTQGPRIQYHQRSAGYGDQASLSGSEISAGGGPRAGAVRLPYAGNPPQLNVRATASIGSADEDLL